MNHEIQFQSNQNCSLDFVLVSRGKLWLLPLPFAVPIYVHCHLALCMGVCSIDTMLPSFQFDVFCCWYWSPCVLSPARMHSHLILGHLDPSLIPFIIGCGIALVSTGSSPALRLDPQIPQCHAQSLLLPSLGVTTAAVNHLCQIVFHPCCCPLLLQIVHTDNLALSIRSLVQSNTLDMGRCHSI